MTTPTEEWETLTPQNSGGIAGLQTSRSSERLNQIDRVRARGVGDHISLPQLVVCGDQSAGKSSVLEGITGIPFPREDGVCTRFATEIILRHQPGPRKITARLLPSKHRPKEDQLRVQQYERQLSSFDDLPDIIREASVIMGIRGTNSGLDPTLVTFAADVLRLEVVGHTGLHLTVVDLPGLISVSEDEDDITTVENLVDEYLESSRTIILAVVQANNDIDTQKIIQRARRFDKTGERTVGIITKPDLINKGTESRIANLVKNIDKTRLRLGFFLLKNPSPIQLQDAITGDVRMKLEADFFRSSPWKEQNLDPARVGIEQLRLFLQDLLDSHIQRELPKVRKEVHALLMDTERELAHIGPERSSKEQIRMFLTQISMEFYNVTKAAVEGNYDGRDAAFFDSEINRDSRLRAIVHRRNEGYAALMRDNGSKRKISYANSQDMEVSRGSSDSDEPVKSEDSGDDAQMSVTKAEMLRWILKIYHDTRGRELPGNFNHILLSELFHEQSSRWAGMARAHVQALDACVKRFVRSVLAHTIADEQVRRNIQGRVQLTLEKNYEDATRELEKILDDEKGQPITYNHYYTDNIQKAREDGVKKGLADSMERAITDDWKGKFHVSNTPMDLDKVLAALKKRVIVDMSQQACSEALESLNAYYKVAMKTFIDNVCRQVIERHILRGVISVFDPIEVSQLSEHDLTRLASETAQVRNRRVELTQLKQALEDSIRELQE